MVVGFLTTEYPSEPTFAGGLAGYLGRVARALVSAGHPVEVFVTGATDQEYEQDGVRVTRVRPHNRWQRRVGNSQYRLAVSGTRANRRSGLCARAGRFPALWIARHRRRAGTGLHGAGPDTRAARPNPRRHATVSLRPPLAERISIRVHAEAAPAEPERTASDARQPRCRRRAAFWRRKSRRPKA